MLVSFALSLLLFLSPCVTDWRKAREGNISNVSPVPYCRKSFCFWQGNMGLVFDCAVLSLQIAVSKPEGAMETRFPVGCCMMGSGCPSGHGPPTPAALDAQRL